MRVIAGSAKGTKLVPVPSGTRPLSDRAREGLFASLGSEVTDASCLDLFAGTGAIGIEALSRGASHCVFVEERRPAVRAIEANLAKTHLEERGEVRNGDVVAFLRRAEVTPTHLVFLDPPYATGPQPLATCVELLDDRWLAPGWTVVMTRGHNGLLPAVPVHWSARRQLRYGDSLLTLYREV